MTEIAGAAENRGIKGGMERYKNIKPLWHQKKHQWDGAVDITAGLPATKDIVAGLSASTCASAAQPAPENTGGTQSEAASSAASLDQLASEFSGQPVSESPVLCCPSCFLPYHPVF
ncbi:hypothetical protein SRHO_G00188320 [Serrasalmus rhombeus]